jgi:hypothetical protein
MLSGQFIDHGCAGLIKHTVSCTRTYDITKLHTHCGCCSQCLDRRFAVLAANAAAHDPVEMDRVELLAGERDKEKDKTMAESYVRTALELHDMGELAFFGRFSGETARVCEGFPSLTADEIGSQVFDLYQRHAQAVWYVLDAAVKRHSGELVNRSLPPSSMLAMTVSTGGAPAIEIIDRSVDRSQSWVDEAETEIESSDSCGVSDERQQGPRRKSRPARERALDAIKELYPKGVPDQAVEPNANLCRTVGEKLKQGGLPGVSDDTILRAAGRRK